MVTLRAPSGASRRFAHAIELLNRDFEGLLDRLDTKQQNEFWENLHQFALAETQNKGRDAGLIAAAHVNAAVREALQIADEKIETHVKDLSEPDRARFWRMLHDAAEEQSRETKQPEARHGGGGEPA